MNLYTIIFKDKTQFSGGTLEKTLWQNVPDKEISSLFYTLPTDDVLCLANFKRIYHFVEVTQDIQGGNKGIINIEFSHLLIERNSKFLHYKINQKNGNISVEELSEESKIIKELNPEGWKNGTN